MVIKLWILRDLQRLRLFPRSNNAAWGKALVSAYGLRREYFPDDSAKMSPACLTSSCGWFHDAIHTWGNMGKHWFCEIGNRAGKSQTYTPQRSSVHVSVCTCAVAGSLKWSSWRLYKHAQTQTHQQNRQACMSSLRLSSLTIRHILHNLFSNCQYENRTLYICQLTSRPNGSNVLLLASSFVMYTHWQSDRSCDVRCPTPTDYTCKTMRLNNKLYDQITSYL